MYLFYKDVMKAVFWPVNYKITKNYGPQFVVLSLFCKFSLLVALYQYLLDTNNICL